MNPRHSRQRRIFTATPEQRSKIAQATACGNRLQKEVIENASALVISALLLYSSHLFVDSCFDILEVQARLSLEIAIELLQQAKRSDPAAFRGWDFFKMYRGYHETSLTINNELNVLPADVFYDKELYLQRLRVAAGLTHKPTLDFFHQVFLGSVQKAQYKVYLNYVSGLTVVTLVLQILFVDVILDKIFARTSSCWARKTPREWLSNDNAEKLINKMMRANSRKKSFTQTTLYSTRIAACVGLLYVAIVFQDQWHSIHPLLIVFLASSVLTTLKNIYLDRRSFQRECNLQGILNEVSNQFKMMLGDFGDCDLKSKGETLNECYLTFTPCTRRLTGSTVNRTVKDILLKNSVDILEYSNDNLTLGIKKLDAEVSNHIKQQIHDYLLAYRNINSLHSQIERFFASNTTSVEVHLRDDETPFVILTINRDPACYNLNNFLQLFPACRLSITNKTITVEGSEPSESYIEFAAGKEQRFVSLPGNSSAVIKRPGRVVKQPQVSPALPEPIPRLINSVIVQEWRIDSKVYKSDAENVFPLKNRAQTYLTFALPITLFPTDRAYAKIKSKVEEGRMASNAVGQQGLQVRPEFVRDDTLPHRPFFLSRLRCKFVGIWGDVRVYARTVVNENHAKLHEFCSVKLSSH
jgi:hypothetical protein